MAPVLLAAFSAHVMENKRGRKLEMFAAERFLFRYAWVKHINKNEGGFTAMHHMCFLKKVSFKVY